MIILVADHILQYIPFPLDPSAYEYMLRLIVEILFIISLLLIFGEIIPKNLALKNAISTVNLTIFPFFLFHELIGFLRIRNFIAFISGKLINTVRRIFGDKEEFANHADIQFAVEMSRKDGHLSREEASIVDKVLELKELPISEIMLHRSRVKTVHPQDTVNNGIKLGVKNRISRFPVYDRKKDSIVGVFQVNKAILESQKGQIQQFMTPPHFIPKVRASEILLEMLLEGKEELAVIVDEFGTYSGIVSSRQILDYLTQSAVKPPENQAFSGIKVAENGIYMHADVKLDMAEKILNCSFPRGDYRTLGGFLMAATGSIPRENEWLVVKGMKFYIDEARPNKIIRVFIQKKGIKL